MSSDVPPVLWSYVEGLKTRNVSKIAAAVSEDLAFVTPTRTLNKPEFLALLRALYDGFPDWQYDHDPPEVNGENVAIRWRQGGTHAGTFSLPGRDPMPATGRRVNIPEQFFFYKVRAGRIVEIRPDPIPGGAPQGILDQIGLK